jgi:hypothetical protein
MIEPGLDVALRDIVTIDIDERRIGRVIAMCEVPGRRPTAEVEVIVPGGPSDGIRTETYLVPFHLIRVVRIDERNRAYRDGRQS